jgi:acyl-CoA thioesterase FadM
VSEKDLGDAKTGIVLTDLVANYKAEGILFDRLVVESSIGEVHARGFRMFHRVSTKDNRLIALAEAGIIAFNYKKRILAKIPEQLLSALAKLMIS